MCGNKCVIDETKKIIFKDKISLYPYETDKYFSIFIHKGKPKNRIWIKSNCSICGKETFQDYSNSKYINVNNLAHLDIRLTDFRNKDIDLNGLDFKVEFSIE